MIIIDPGIYKIQSKIKPERFYIGSSTNVCNRWKMHLTYLRHNKHHSPKLQHHFNKYGESDLVFSLLITCDKNDLLKNEQFFLDCHKPYFNTNMIAEKPPNTKGRIVSEETRKKLSIANKGHIPWCKGKKMPPISEELRRKLSESHKGQISAKGMLGKKMSKETKERMSISQRKRGKRSEEFRETIRKSWVIRRLNKQKKCA